MKTAQITTLFVDIGGVLLTNGWDHHARERAAAKFQLDFSEFDERHHAVFASYEEGKLTLEEYLNRTVFHENRTFTRDRFREFMFAQSQPYPEMLELVPRLKRQHELKIVVVSNEARELNAHRIRKFRLDTFVDAFISSCFVHLRKPDTDILRLALDVAQVSVEQVVYLENTPMFVDVAAGLGIRGIVHTDWKSTCEQLGSFGLRTEAGLMGA